MAASLVVGAAITTAFWTTMHGGTATHKILYALYVWTGLFGSWAMVQIWTLLGRAHTMTQAKRLYGFIGAGAVLGGVVGAILARVTISAMSPRSAVLMAAGIFVLATLPCLLIKLPVDEAVVRPRRGTEVKRVIRRPISATVSLLWEEPFARRVLYIVLVSTITVTVADYLFKSQIAAQITDTRELGRWLSTFYAVTNTLALVAQLAIAPWVFRRAGVQRALFFFPAAMLVAAGGVIFTAGALAASVALKGLDGALRYSIHKTSTELLLVPVPDGLRERIKPIIDLVGSRGGQAFASVAILGLVAVGGAAARPPVLGAIVFALSVMWLALVVTIRGLYLDVFRETLKSGGLSGSAELPELDLGALETLFAGLNSSRDADVITSLELLAEQHRERLIPALILYHPSREVVLRSLDIFTDLGRSDFVSIADRLNRHPDGAVAAAALRARTAVLPAQELLKERLGDTSPQVSVTALIALMARGWIDLEDADRRLEAALTTKSSECAAELARAIRAMAPKRGANAQVEDRFDDLLVRLDQLAPAFHDLAVAPGDGQPQDDRPDQPSNFADGPPDIRIRLEVARAMRSRDSPKFILPLMHMLSRHELRAVARQALAGIPGALEAMDEALSVAQLPREIRTHLPRTIALFEPKASAAVLLRHLEDSRDGAIRFKVIRALVRLRRSSPELELDQEILTRFASEMLHRVEGLRRWGRALSLGDEVAAASLRAGSDPLQAAHHLLVDLVRDKELHATQRLFLLLELIYGDPFDDIWRGLRSKNPKSHASSLELLENLVKEPLRARVLSLLGDSAAEAEAEVEAEAEAETAALAARDSTQPQPLTYVDAIREILGHHSTTMRTLAEYRATQLGIDITAIKRPPRIAEESPFEAGLGERLLDKVTDLLTPETSSSEATRAPA